MLNLTNSIQIGGQAVINGVMMRTPQQISIAVRRAHGSITIKNKPYHSLIHRYPFLKIPVIRGGIILIETMIIGVRALNFSAEVAAEDVEKKEKSDGENAALKKDRRHTNNKISTIVSVLIAVGIAFVLFFILPLYTATALFDVEQAALGFNLTAGLIRIGILLGYIYLVSRIKDVREVFQYHGAEHKAVSAYENGKQLTVDGAKDQSRFHPRCGTSFILQVALIAILGFAILDWVIIKLYGETTFILRLITHLPLIPLIAGVSYEIIKLSARFQGTLMGNIFIAPGLWLQRFTTQEPDSSQIGVALVALQNALGESINEEKPHIEMTEVVT